MIIAIALATKIVAMFLLRVVLAAAMVATLRQHVLVNARAEEVTIDEFVDGTMKLKGSRHSILLTDVS